MDAARGTVAETPVYLALFLGLRRSEIAGLRWEDVDLEGGKVTIRHKTVQYMDKGSLVTASSDKLKTDSSNRVLPIPDGLKEVLSSMEDKQGPVCKGYHRQAMTPDLISRAFHRAQEQAGLRHIRFHDLRHTCASLLLSAGASMKQVQVILGHSHYSTTADIYSHIDLKGKEAALDRLDNLIRN